MLVWHFLLKLSPCMISYPTLVLSLDYKTADFPDSPNILATLFKIPSLILIEIASPQRHFSKQWFLLFSLWVTGGSCRCAAVSNIFPQGNLKNKSRTLAQHFFLPFAVWTGVKRCMLCWWFRTNMCRLNGSHRCTRVCYVLREAQNLREKEGGV